MIKKKVGLLLILVVGIFSCSSDDASKETSVVTVGDSNYRPAYHFTPEANWMNDPNGMVYYAGEYHLFFQYNPDATVWGPMHWGHAVSEDLVNWEELPIALYPDDLGNIFSGSAVVDKNNTTGFKTGNEDPLVAIFTHHNPESNEQYQSLAYSLDKGRTWIKYDGNPVLKNPDKIDFRDPKVRWHEESAQWIMSVAAGNEILFYASPDLKEWQYLSAFGEDSGAHGGVWECPDLFPLTSEDGEEKWALLVSINPGGPNGGSGTQYFIGSFDGEKFTTEQEETLWLDYGTDNYAGVTWSNEPQERQLFMGWMSNWNYAQNVPTVAWRSTMTLPRTLHLAEKNGQYLLMSTPAEEIENLSSSSGIEQNLNFPVNSVALEDNEVLKTAEFQQETTLDFSEINNVEITWGNGTSEVVLKYDQSEEKFVIDRSKAGYNFNDLNGNIISADYALPESEKLVLNVWVDKSSIEVFVNNGELVLTVLVFPRTPFPDLSIASNRDTPFIETLKISTIKNE